MQNLFEVLSLRCDLTISDSEIDQSWRTLSQEHHPDLIGKDGVDISTRINEARDVLTRPAGRLEQWLRVKSGESSPRNASLNEDLMCLFSTVGDSLGRADEAIKAIKASRTALAKSLLMPGTLAAQKRIQTSLGEIHRKIGSITDRFPEFEADAEKGEFQKAIAALGELKFLEKWQRECQQRLLELIAIE
ncbi:MAG: J domain-containing protein [Verrucomicrobiales bacterium]|nr:J domain-containing protein [Verrucomicrobiales bacterium]